MAASSYPNLGFDPCPGDLRGYQALAAYAGRSATTLANAVRALASAGPQEWRGQAADAFRAHVDQDVLPLARKASDSVGKAAAALRTWAITLAGLQDEARALDQQAAPYRAGLDAALRSAGLPAGGAPPCPATVKPSQKAQLDEANTGLAGILAKADELHSRYLAAVQRADGRFEDAGNMAPSPPGLCAFLRHGAETIYDYGVHGLSEFVHNKALLEFISTVANIVATVAELLALFPSLTPIFGPIAIAAAVTALGAEALLAGFNHGSWGTVAMDAAAMVSDAGWMRAASKLADMYKLAGLFKEIGLTGPMTQARTLTGLVIGKTVDVAPGMFRMIGDSLKNVRDWGSKIATSKAPWQEPADTATGQA